MEATSLVIEGMCDFLESRAAGETAEEGEG